MQITIDDIVYEVNEDQRTATLLELALEKGVEIPHLCFLKNNDCLNALKCGVCQVRVQKDGKLTPAMACNLKLEDGLVVYTDTDEIRENQRKRVISILNKHEFKCGSCIRRENCELLALASKLKAKPDHGYEEEDPEKLINSKSVSVTINHNKCILCGRCEFMCHTATGTDTIKIQNIDGKRQVAPINSDCFDETNCLLCGQCINACPVAALQATNNIDQLVAALEDETKHVVVGPAPSVRTSLGELFGFDYGTDTSGQMYTALHQLGFDKVWDINFGADLTVMEEGNELVERVRGNGIFPMFTSCCPAWVRLAQNYYPEKMPHLSTVKSPVQMFGAMTKTYYPATNKDVDVKDIVTVIIVPCVAKKWEATQKQMASDGYRDIDIVLSVRELAQLIKSKNIPYAELPEGKPDPAMGDFSADGAAFGYSGGVARAALHAAQYLYDKTVNHENTNFQPVPGYPRLSELTEKLGDIDVRVAVINGSDKALEYMNDGILDNYHMVEVMACQGGCINGGGQPHISSSKRIKEDVIALRKQVIVNKMNELHNSIANENKEIQQLYNTFLGDPGGPKAHEYLHRHYKK